MTSSEIVEVSTTFAAYRGARIEAGSAELREFAAIFGGANAPDVRDAIRLAAERDGRVFLETVAKRHAEIRSERFTASVREREASKRAAPTEPTRPGWPVLPGSPTGAYLTCIGWLAIRQTGPAAARRAADRYVAAGFVLAEHADALISEMWPDGPALKPSERAEVSRQFDERLAADLGPWARVQAERYVETVRLDQSRGAA